MRLHVLCEPLLHGVHTATHWARERAQLWGLGRYNERSEGERRGQSRKLSPPTHHPISSPGPFPGQGPTLTGSGLFFLGKEKPSVTPQLPHGHRVSVLTTPPSLLPMENQWVSIGKKAEAPQVTSSIMVKRVMVLSPPFTQYTFALEAPRSSTGKALVTGILAGYTIPSLSRILENCHTPWLQDPTGPPSAHRSYAKKVNRSLPKP